MKVKVTLEVEVPEGTDDRGTVDLLVEDACLDVGFGDDGVWEQYHVKWEPIEP